MMYMSLHVVNIKGLHTAFFLKNLENLRTSLFPLTVMGLTASAIS